MAVLAGAVATIVRLSFVGCGTMAFVDERRYITVMLGLRALSEGHVRDFFQAINSLGARPADGLWRAIPGLGQAALLGLFRLNPNSPPSLQVPQVFNVLVMSLNACVLYKIYRRFFSLSFALLGIALYSSLVNTNLYLRHLLPYDHALFFFLLALWLLLSAPEEKTVRRYGVAGLLSAFSYALYPGYFMGPAVLLGLGLLLAMLQKFRPNHPKVAVRLLPVAAQLASFLAVLLLFEGLALFSDTSYFASSRYMATTVVQGSFDEGVSFIGQYFWQVEGWFGVGLLALFGAGLGLSIRALSIIGAQRGSNWMAQLSLSTLLLLGFVAWVGYAVMVQVGHRLVFYGRIIHFFVPLIVLGAVVVLQAISRYWQPAQKPLLISSYALAFWHFGIFGIAYRAIAYPCDVAYAYGIRDARQLASIETTGCDKNLIYYRVFGPRNRDQRTAEFPKCRLLNFAYLYPLSCYETPAPRFGNVIASVPYFMRYLPYQFEGHDPDQRALLQNNPYNFQIISEN